MWADRSLFPFKGQPRPIDARMLIGIAWLRVSAANEAYGLGDLPGAQHHVKMAQIAAAQTLAEHRGMRYRDINDVFMATKYCHDELGAPVDDLFNTMARMAEVELTEEVLTDHQHDEVEAGLASARELVALVEGIMQF